MKSLFISFLLVVFALQMSFAQSLGFNYQAVLRDAEGNIITNQNVGVQTSIISDNPNGNIVYVERFITSTNQFGLVNLVIGTGQVQQGVFGEIDWSQGIYFIRVEVDANGGNNYIELGTSQLLSVPFAQYAFQGNEGMSAYETWLSLGNTGTEEDFINSLTGPPGDGAWDDTNNTLSTTKKVGVGTSTPFAKLGVKGDVPIESDEPLFEVVNANGDTVFAVYSTGVRVNVFDDPTGKATGKRGGFAVAGFDQSKGVTKEYLRVTPDSVRVYVDRDSAKATGKRGGFAVAGFDQSKGVAKEYLRVTPDSVRVYVEREISKASGKRGGFAVAGFDQSKGTTQEYMRVTPDSVRVYIGNMAKATGKRGGFAVAGFDQSKGIDSSYLFVGADTTEIATVFKSSKDVVVKTDIFKSTGEFYVPDELATISTGFVSNVGADSAIAWGNITSDGRSDVTVRGICWSTAPNPTTADAFVAAGSGTGEFTGKLTGLSLNTTYYLRAYATNAVGTAYGNEVQFNSAAAIPTVLTSPVTNITATTATGGGEVTDDGGAMVTNRGLCWSNSTTPTIGDNIVTSGNGIGEYTVQITGLDLDSTYYVRAYAINSAGVAYGSMVQFTTTASPPEIATTAVSAITDSTAVSGGNITSDGGSAITSRGVCWSIDPMPGLSGSFTNNGSGIGVFESNLTNLSAGTTYYVRAYAINAVDTAYGEQVSFTTTGVSFGTEIVEVTNPVTGKTWMDRNLGASRAATSSTDEQAYGDLYQWGRGTDGHEKRTSGTTTTLSTSDTPGHGDFIFAQNSPYDWRSPQNDNLWQGVGGSNNPCPGGYRIPTETEWEAERLSWGSNDTAGAFASSLKLPVTGFRYINGSLQYVGSAGFCWSSTVDGANSRGLRFTSSDASMGSSRRNHGYSVRCIKDSETPSTIPTVTTTAISDTTETTAVSGGNVTDDGGTGVVARGVCWSTAENPTTADSFTSDGSGTGTFTSNITGLTENTTYYVRAYATNSEGTAYGEQISFTTLAAFAGTVVVDVTNPTTGKTWMDRSLGASRAATSSTDEQAYGDLYQWGRGTDGHEKRTSGTTTTLSTSDTPGHGDFITNGSSPYDWHSPQNDNLWQGVSGTNNPCPSGYRLPTEAEWESERTGWSSNNIAGAYASPLKLPVAGRRFSSDGSLSVVGGDYWSSTVDGTFSRFLIFGSSNAFMNSNYRALGFSVRCIKDSGTPITLPTINTYGISDTTETTAVSGGEVTDDGGATVTARGVCWNTSGSPTIADNFTSDGSGTGTFTSNITGLTENTTYYVRAYATNSEGTAYGNQVSFTTLAASAGTVVVEVTNPTTGKIWMDRNLGASRAATSSTDEQAYGDLYQWGRGTDGHEKRTSGTTTTLSTSDTPGHGDFILAPNSPYDWRSPQNDNLWQGVDGTNNPCPSGYRLPTDTEWEAERASWSSNNTAGAFASPLKLPVAGNRDYSNGSLYDVGSGGHYWSSTVDGTYSRYLNFNSSAASMGSYFRAFGFSVRCIKE
jgi:uncharacterized protein (TIGR02145 family)